MTTAVELGPRCGRVAAWGQAAWLGPERYTLMSCSDDDDDDDGMMMMTSMMKMNVM